LQGGPRLGMVIGRHQVARAVERTRLKRIIREVFRLRQHQLGPIDVVVRYRSLPGTDGANAAIRPELNELLGQVEA
jgi:ribonuclease P protein component